LCVFKVSIARTLGLFTKSSLPYTLHWGLCGNFCNKNPMINRSTFQNTSTIHRIYVAKSAGRNIFNVGWNQYTITFLCFGFSFFVIMALEMYLVCSGVTVPEARQKKAEQGISKKCQTVGWVLSQAFGLMH
jgi:hypothetical protein